MADFFSSRNSIETPEEKRRARELKRARRIIRSSREPVIPLLCRIFFVCMIAFPILDAVMEVATYIKSGGKLGGGRLLHNISWSMLLIWGLFAVLLVLLADMQLIRNARGAYEEKVYRFPADLRPGERLSDFQVEQIPESFEDPREREQMTLYVRALPGGTRARYLRYILVAGTGLAILAAFYFIVGRVTHV